jgi:hypothetical protein
MLEWRKIFEAEDSDLGAIHRGRPPEMDLAPGFGILGDSPPVRSNNLIATGLPTTLPIWFVVRL